MYPYITEQSESLFENCKQPSAAVTYILIQGAAGSNQEAEHLGRI